MKIMSVVGARPQFVKLAPIAAAARTAGIDHLIVHTGQHYDPIMSDAFFADLQIPSPDFHLGVGSGSHGAQTAKMLEALESVVERARPDWVLVYGDTNSTLAAAIASVKLHVPVAHLEAGLRSFNRRMPEEHNRVLTDHASDLLLAPTQTAMDHLSAEGLAARAVLVGDVMADVCLMVKDQVADKPNPLADTLGTSTGYLMATVHRAENTDDPDRLTQILQALAAVDKPVVLLAHPRLRARAQEFDLPLQTGSITACEPLAYPDMVAAMVASDGLLTDSGGLQKEAYLLGVPCTTLRHETEWVETLDLGWNVLAGDLTRVVELATRPRPEGERPALYGSGDSATKVIQTLSQFTASTN